jgi:hypothetical protein
MVRHIKSAAVLAGGAAVLASASVAGGAARPDSNLAQHLVRGSVDPALIRSEPKNEWPFTRAVGGK